MKPGKPDRNKKYLAEIRKRMLESGGIIRDMNRVKNACREASALLKKLNEKIRAGSVSEISENEINPELCLFDRDVEKKIIEVGLSYGNIRIKMEEVREIPKQDLWFERIS